MKFLLSHTPTNDHRVEIADDGQIVLTQTTHFELSAEDARTVAWFIGEVKKDKATRHTYTDPSGFILEYEPGGSDLKRFRIYKTRTIAMALSTAYKLLDALQGKTERLVKEDEDE